MASKAEIALESEQYLRDKNVHHLLNSLVKELVEKKPDDALGFMAGVIPQMKQRLETQALTAQPRSRYPSSLDERPLTVIVLGASGDLAQKKTFPALYQLHSQGLLPPNVNIVGYARSDLGNEGLHAKVRKGFRKDAPEELIQKFFARVTYHKGAYDKDEDFKSLNEYVSGIEKGVGNRLYYLALPPAVFLPACRCLKGYCMSPEPGWSRVVIEKPFGHDTESSAQLTEDLSALLKEDQIYRIDHYLGKEMVQNLITLRFANKIFSHCWDKTSIDNVQITFKETIGTMGRGGYFDTSGIIRDVLQNHLIQVLALIAMEKPKSLNPESVRDEKVEVLRHVRPVPASDTVLGQYGPSEDGKNPGYQDDETVPKGSNTPTLAQVVLWIDNDRWHGVPFILKAAKAVEKKEVVIRLQFKPEIRPFGGMVDRNELVVRLQPDEAMYLKINSKDPGMTSEVHTTELDLTYRHRYCGIALPDAYESLIYEAVNGNPTNFVRSDELDAAWRIFTPLLKQIDAREVVSEIYPFGSRGPPRADEVKRSYYMPANAYKWTDKQVCAQ